MGNNVDNLLNAALLSENEEVDTRIILTIDEPTRTINYDKPLILGVKGDRFAERVYFNCPQNVLYKDNNTSIDLALATTKIYINYQNANGESLIEECHKSGILEDGKFLFSWLISDMVAIKDGDVTFNVCIKDESSAFVNDDNVIVSKEWHTTTFTGSILPAIDVDDETHEVLTSDTVTSKSILDAMSNYQKSVDALNESFGDAEDYIDDKVGEYIDENSIVTPIPTKTSQLENDSGFLTEHQDLSEYAKTEDIPTKTSQLENDSGFLTEHQDLSEYALKSDIPTATTTRFNFLNKFTYEDAASIGIIDISDYVNDWNEIMIICRSEIVGDAQLIISLAASSSLVHQIDDLTGTRYTKILINKTSVDGDGAQYLDITSVDSINGSDFSWVDLEQEDEDTTVILDLGIQGTTTTANLTIKIYGR